MEVSQDSRLERRSTTSTGVWDETTDRFAPVHDVENHEFLIEFLHSFLFFLSLVGRRLALVSTRLLH